MYVVIPSAKCPSAYAGLATGDLPISNDARVLLEWIALGTSTRCGCHDAEGLSGNAVGTGYIGDDAVSRDMQRRNEERHELVDELHVEWCRFDKMAKSD